MTVPCVLVDGRPLTELIVQVCVRHGAQSEMVTLKTCVIGVLQNLSVIHHGIRQLVFEINKPLFLNSELLARVVLTIGLEIFRISVLLINDVKILIVYVGVLVGMNIIPLLCM